MWVEFMNKVSPPLSPSSAFVNGAVMIFIDSLGCGGSCDLIRLKNACMRHLQELVDDNEDTVIKHEVVRREGVFGITPFIIETGMLGIYVYYMLMLLLIAVSLSFIISYYTTDY